MSKDRKKVRPNLKRLSQSEIKALTPHKKRPVISRLTDAEYREIWNGVPPKQDK